MNAKIELLEQEVLALRRLLDLKDEIIKGLEAKVSQSSDLSASVSYEEPTLRPLVGEKLAIYNNEKQSLYTAFESYANLGCVYSDQEREMAKSILYLMIDMGMRTQVGGPIHNKAIMDALDIRQPNTLRKYRNRLTEPVKVRETFTGTYFVPGILSYAPNGTRNPGTYVLNIYDDLSEIEYVIEDL